MARRRLSSLFKPKELASWNLILFLTLSFILLVVALSATNKIALDMRSRAAGNCPAVTLPRAEDCPVGWTFKRDASGCLAFFCESSK